MSWCAVGLARVGGTRRMFPAPLLLQCRRLATGGRTSDDILELCRRRCFLLGEKMTPASVLGGRHSLGPLGAQMKRNLIKEWWDAMVLHREQVLPIDSLCRLPGMSNPSPGPPPKTLSKACLERLQNQSPTQEELEKMADLRQDLLNGWGRGRRLLWSGSAQPRLALSGGTTGCGSGCCGGGSLLRCHPDSAAVTTLTKTE